MSAHHTDKEALINRLKRIEGQIKGIQRMIDNEKYCGEVLTQITAAKAALEKVGGLILEGHMKNCIKSAVEEKNDENIDELIKVTLKFMK